MKNPFFKNFGPIRINILLKKLEIENIENFKDDKIFDVKDLLSATSKDLSFFHSNNYFKRQVISFTGNLSDRTFVLLRGSFRVDRA